MSFFDVDEFLLVRKKSPGINEAVWTTQYKLEASVIQTLHVKLNHIG